MTFFWTLFVFVPFAFYAHFECKCWRWHTYVLCCKCLFNLCRVLLLLMQIYKIHAILSLTNMFPCLNVRNHQVSGKTKLEQDRIDPAGMIASELPDMPAPWPNRSPVLLSKRFVNNMSKFSKDPGSQQLKSQLKSKQEASVLRFT